MQPLFRMVLCLYWIFNFFLSLSLAVSSVELGKKGNGSPMSDSSIPDESAAFSNGTVYLLMFFVFKIKNAVDLKWLSACTAVDLNDNGHKSSTINPPKSLESVDPAAEFPPTVPSLRNILDDSAAHSNGTNCLTVNVFIFFCHLFKKNILISMPRCWSASQRW